MAKIKNKWKSYYLRKKKERKNKDWKTISITIEVPSEAEMLDLFYYKTIGCIGENSRQITYQYTICKDELVDGNEISLPKDKWGLWQPVDTGKTREDENEEP